MRRLAVLVAVLGFATPAAAVEPSWEPLGDSRDEASIEIDRASLERREGLLTLWLRIDFAEPVRGRIQPFRSAVAQLAVDCRRRRHATIRMTTYSDRLGEGDVIDRWDSSPESWVWRAARGDPADAQILHLACDQAPARAPGNAIPRRARS